MKLKHSIQPYLLILVFFGPLLFAAVAYYGPWEWLRQTAAAHGELIDPPLPLPRGALTTPSGGETAPNWFQYRWSLIYARTAPCDQPCISELNRLNQVRLALGKDLGRAQVVLLFAGAPPPLPAGADVIVARLDNAAGGAMLDLLEARGIRDGRIYISDPAGQLIMTYPPDAEQSGILEDLERLLSVYRID